MAKVFVYGTLKKGGRLHAHLEGSVFLGVDIIRGFKMHNLGWYPGIVPVEDKESVVHGEVYEIDKVTQARLDWVEGMPHLYERVFAQSAENGWVETYIYQGQPNNPIEDGVWQV